eukprot:Gregarina_sp_Poly_1__6363@NODE_3391_length_1128_cov_6_858624_g2145_i0_p1_GENE_NODE_3391_length_1128_cov_6_858624_g2145_i0NODE_3391_length_1128_cov_6_858624_g2145_i0_p1_ORF_typecomplete_len313_score46_53CDRN/PF05174_12/0_25_NODE_3391_length_1128_cov_6_858624_g2145_i058996
MMAFGTAPIASESTATVNNPRLSNKLRNVRRRVKAAALSSLPRKFDPGDAELVGLYVEHVLRQILRGKTNEFVFGFEMDDEARTCICEKAKALSLSSEVLNTQIPPAVRVILPADSWMSVLYAYKHDLLPPAAATTTISAGVNINGELILHANSETEACQMVEAAEQMGLRAGLLDSEAQGEKRGINGNEEDATSASSLESNRQLVRVCRLSTPSAAVLRPAACPVLCLPSQICQSEAELTTAFVADCVPLSRQEPTLSELGRPSGFNGVDASLEDQSVAIRLPPSSTDSAAMSRLRKWWISVSAGCCSFAS